MTIRHEFETLAALADNPPTPFAEEINGKGFV